jgi:hypothetical protein
MQFTRATMSQSCLRLALLGPPGSGKTYTALTFAHELRQPTQSIALIDAERGSASKYADTFDFDVLNLDTFSPQTYIDAIDTARRAGYPVLIIDSLSHAWSGKDGALEQVDRAAKRNQGNSFAGWRDVTPLHNRMLDAILAYPGHVIVTMRVKVEWVVEKDPRTGKNVPRKVGMAPIQREGMEYEFDVVGDMSVEHDFVITKSRCSLLADQVFHRPGREVTDVLKRWLAGNGKPAQQPQPAPAGEDAAKSSTKPSARQRTATPTEEPASADAPSPDEPTVTPPEARPTPAPIPAEIKALARQCFRNPGELARFCEEHYGAGAADLTDEQRTDLIERLSAMATPKEDATS